MNPIHIGSCRYGELVMAHLVEDTNDSPTYAGICRLVPISFSFMLTFNPICINVDGVPKEMRADETLVRLAKISLVEEKVYVHNIMHYVLSFTLGHSLVLFGFNSKTRLFLEYVAETMKLFSHK